MVCEIRGACRRDGQVEVGRARGATAEARMSGGGILQMGNFRWQYVFSSELPIALAEWQPEAAVMRPPALAWRLGYGRWSLRAIPYLLCRGGSARTRSNANWQQHWHSNQRASPFCIDQLPSVAEFHIDKLSLITCIVLHHKSTVAPPTPLVPYATKFQNCPPQSINYRHGAHIPDAHSKTSLTLRHCQL